jgi:hypothetical protein
MIGLSAKVSWLLVLLASAAPAFGAPEAEQIVIARVERMPNLPQPYRMRDWQKVTEDYLEFLGNTEGRGEHLPLLAWPGAEQPQIRLPSYVGGPGGPEAINFLAAIVSGGLVGKDMRRFRGHDWVTLSTNYFSTGFAAMGGAAGAGQASGMTCSRTCCFSRFARSTRATRPGTKCSFRWPNVGIRDVSLSAPRQMGRRFPTLTISR